jgi:hypothetical protein
VTGKPPRLRALLEVLIEADVQFVLVGGLAVNAWGHLRSTADIDLVPDPDPKNLERLATALESVGGRVIADGALLEAPAIRTFLRAGDRTLVDTDLGPVDVLQGLPQVPTYAEASDGSVEVSMDGLAARVCSLETLLAMKRASDRPRDRDDVEALESL